MRIVNRFVLPMLAAFSLAASPALADKPTKEAKTGATTVLANVVYMPAKVLYAAGGGMVAGFAYLFSAGDKEVAKPILDAAIGGDYVVEKEHLSGEKKLVFFGQSEEQQRAKREAEGELGDVAAQPEPGF
ncbi:MAG TPA: hypothetical protein VFT98_08975 [Myxococcota bacterium]|nr:hypothetical protein [Myxococcota bacterium]